MDPLRTGLNLRSQLLADGLTDAELRASRRRGLLTPVRPGAYVHGPEPDDEAARHLLAVGAALPCLGAGTVVSHTSAAVVHGLPLGGSASTGYVRPATARPVHGAAPWSTCTPRRCIPTRCRWWTGCRSPPSRAR